MVTVVGTSRWDLKYCNRELSCFRSAAKVKQVTNLHHQSVFVITFNYSPHGIIAQEEEYEATLKAQKHLTQQLEGLEETLKFADSNRVFKELKESYEKDKEVGGW